MHLLRYDTLYRHIIIHVSEVYLSDSFERNIHMKCHYFNWICARAESKSAGTQKCMFISVYTPRCNIALISFEQFVYFDEVLKTKLLIKEIACRLCFIVNIEFKAVFLMFHCGLLVTCHLLKYSNARQKTFILGYVFQSENAYEIIQFTIASMICFLTKDFL